MRYGREEGRLFDTATSWGCAVIYNGNTSELTESSMACKNHTHTENCTQIEAIWAFLSPFELPRTGYCVLGIKVSV